MAFHIIYPYDKIYIKKGAKTLSKIDKLKFIIKFVKILGLGLVKKLKVFVLTWVKNFAFNIQKSKKYSLYFTRTKLLINQTIDFGLIQ